MAKPHCFAKAGTPGCVIGALLGLLTVGRAQADVPPLQLQAIGQQSAGGCASFPELDGRIEAEIKQLTGRVTHRSTASAVNPTLTPAASTQVFGGYIEPLDAQGWRARLWLKDVGKSQVAVRDTYYRNLERLSVELPADAAALVILPDWSRTASAAPQYCQTSAKSLYPEDACDPFLPPPSCGVAFDCTQSDQAPRCPAGPACGRAGQPACPPPATPCRGREIGRAHV